MGMASLKGCQSDPFNRPKIKNCVVLENSQCECSYSNGETEMIDCFGYQAASPLDYKKLRNYCEDKETRLEICLKYPKKCQ